MAEAGMLSRPCWLPKPVMAVCLGNTDINEVKLKKALGGKEVRMLTDGAEVAKELGISRQTLYRYVSPTGELRPQGRRILTHAKD